jgi:type IV pilus assembly protein PilY1
MFKPTLSRIRFAAIAAASLLVASTSPASATGMTDYCQVPPYVIQNVPPTIMMLMDISGSMFNLAYRDGFNTSDTSDDAVCNTTTSPCTGFTNPGTYPAFKYYGYFDPDRWYTYGSNSFTASGWKVGASDNTSPTRAKTSSEWDGNFLNWMTMRRIDVIRKVLTGGKPSGGTVEGEIGDCNDRGKYFRITNAQNYTSYSGTKTFDVNPSNRTTCDGGGSGNGSFCDQGNCNNANTFNTKVSVTGTPTGVLQNTVGARARVGLAFFRVNEGGYVQTVPTGTSLSAVVNQINLTRPNANTPLGEALWSVAGYFTQTTSVTGFTSPSGTGPRYANGDYSVNTNNDPLNYGTGGSSRYPTCAKSFVLLLTDGEPCSDGNLPTSMADYANGRSDFNCTGSTCSAQSGTGFSFPAWTLPTCSAGGAVGGLEDVALWMHNTDLRNSPSIGTDNIAGKQNLTLYTVAAFAPSSTLLKYASINGGYVDTDNSGAPDTVAKWDSNGDGVPDTYFEANDGAELETKVKDAFSGMLKRASSGTAASVLASGEGSGANLLQAIFYPRRSFGSDIIGWTGSLQNLWYYVDPFFTNANIREETPTADGKLKLDHDYIAQFFYDPATELTKVHRFNDSDGDGAANSAAGDVSFESMNSLWEAGKKLHARVLADDPRTIYTQIDNTNLYGFTVANQSTLSSYLMPATGDNATNIIRYVLGYDDDNDGDGLADFRNRTITYGGTDNAVWKLGDVVDSTPRVVAGIPLNKYYTSYADLTYKAFTDNTNYKNRGMAFVGGNDGMLHAFKMGRLDLNWSGQLASEKAKETNLDTSIPLGHERWGFIPKNSLPYLKYLKDPDYCHLYYVDLAPYVFDASIGSGSGDQSTEVRTQASWRTVLIAGMRTGGACANSCATGDNCVQAPAANTGYSSYFALDVTDPENPSLLWEFTNPALGFATTGPAVVRIHGLNAVGGTTRDPSRNGEWYAVFGSGPTGPIDNTNMQFLARSNQNLKYFIVNIKTGALVQTIDTGVTNAFGGSMINSVADVNLDYQDDAIYVGYTKRAGGAGNTFTDGGIGRIFTKNVSPSNVSGGGWAYSSVMSGVGPVTTTVARLQNNLYHAEWLYFGTGRFFYAQPPQGTNSTPSIDDADGQRRIVAVKEPCFTTSNLLNYTCTTAVTFPSTTDSNFPNVTVATNAPSDALANSAAFKGWYINLDASGNDPNDNTNDLFGAERIITDPLASTSGLVFFTSFKPYAQECGLGGKSYIWAINYNTGGAPAPAKLKGKALVQVSTASVEQLDMSTAFTPATGESATGLHKGGRRSFSIEGVPPTAQGLSLLLPPPPVNRVLHMKER